jgi:hypothetical protein
MHQHISSGDIFTKIFKLFSLAFYPKGFRAHSIQAATRLPAKWLKSILQYCALIQKDTHT